MRRRRRRAAAAVRVDVAGLSTSGRPTVDDYRYPPSRKALRERVVAVEGREHDAVDMARSDVLLETLLLLAGLWHEEDELETTKRECGADPIEKEEEERVTEEPGGRHWEDHTDRIAPAGHQASRGTVRNVTEASDRLLHGSPRLRAHLRAAVHDPGNRR